MTYVHSGDINMATYASTTNPFIKSNSQDNGLKRPCQKEAPGTAVPQSLINDINKQKEANLLLSNSDSGHSYESRDSNEKHNEISSHDCYKETAEQLDCPLNGSNDHSNDDYDEITKTSGDLVEAVIRLELEESTKEIDTNKRKDSHIVKGQDQDAAKLDDDNEVDLDNEPPPMEQDSRQHQHIELIKKLRLQLRDLERYAYERGELDQVPPSVLAERQTVILDTLKDRLSLNVGVHEIEKLELDKLKEQVDKEIHDLIDPLITKEHLLGQLKTQLTDLERYIEHLHGTLGKIHDKKRCLCHLHGCSSQTEKGSSQDKHSLTSPSNLLRGSSLMNNDALPKTSRLIRSLVTQLICSDIKLQESAKKEKAYEQMSNGEKNVSWNPDYQTSNDGAPSVKVQNFHDEAAWSLHIDKVVLATDSLVNLFTLEPQYQRPADKPVDDGLVESIVRRQLVPALRDLLSYGLIDPDSLPSSSSYASLLFDPYSLLSSLTCFPSLQKPTNISDEEGSSSKKIHVWSVIEEYYKTRNEPGFQSSSVKTLSQSFNLAPSISGPIKITSKQALLIAVEDIVDTLSKCRPNGPESHFRVFIYTALNQAKLPTWLRLVFKNKSIVRKYYHNFSFISQPDKMGKLLTIIEALNQIEFKLRTDIESIEQFVSAF